MTNPRFERNDHRVTTRDGVGLRVRTVQLKGVAKDAPVIVLVHGIAAPLEPTYDLEVPGYSFLEELAGRGYRAVALDHRNFGRSDRGPALGKEPVLDPEGKGVHSLDDSVEDIRAVIADACARFGVPSLTLFGSSRGAIQVLAYAAMCGEQITLAIINNPSSLCYLAGVTEPAQVEMMKAAREGAKRTHNYIPYTAEFQRKRWQKLFGDKETVDSELQEAYIQACIRSDEEGSRRDPAVFRVPSEAFPERVPLVPLKGLKVPVLVVEAEEMPEAHVEAFFASMPKGRARLMYIRDSNHFTLRNARRFELANIIDVAATGRRWGAEG